MASSTANYNIDNEPKKASKTTKATAATTAKELDSLKKEVAELKGEIASLKRKSINGVSATTEVAENPEVERLLRDLACLVLAKDLHLGRSSKTLFKQYQTFLTGGPL